jgi:twitching motility protein PilT
MVMTPSTRAAIKNNNTGEIYQMMAESKDLGMVTLEQDLKRLYLAKKISLDNAVVSANNKRRFQQIMNLTAVGD